MHYPDAQAMRLAASRDFRRLGLDSDPNHIYPHIPDSAIDIAFSWHHDDNTSFWIYTISDDRELLDFATQLEAIPETPAYCEPSSDAAADWWREEIRALPGEFEDLNWQRKNTASVGAILLRGPPVYRYYCGDRRSQEPPC